MHMRLFLKALLETGGYSVTICRNGEEGMSAVREKKPDVVILDVMMPKEGGIQMYRRLKGDQELREIPVIMLSGVSRPTFLHSLKMLSFGAGHGMPEPEAYVEKPPEPEAFLDSVHSVLAVRPARTNP